jgi:dephospho-CoA kinase
MPDSSGRSADGVFVLGLVGRAGSGKSTVARTLASAGAAIVEADHIGHEVTDGDPEVRFALMRAYGPDVYRADGTLDRTCVGARVFSDATALAELNALVHPRIVARIRAALADFRRAGRPPVVVVDAALMLDWGLERDCDAVLAVVAPDAVQMERLMAARGWTERQARARLEAQRSNAAFEAAADAVIRNVGTREELERAAHDALARLRPASGRARRG